MNICVPQERANAEAVLLTLLAAGPVSSRVVLEKMACEGFTPKQVRRARERRGIVAARSGSGVSMHSVWSLPPAGREGGAIRALEETPAEVLIIVKVRGAGSAGTKVSAEAAVSISSHPVTPCADLTIGEQNRVARRVHQFITGGMDAAAGRALAARLVVERDRPSSRAGSCIECQCLQGKSCTPGTHLHTPGPRDLAEIWMCWCARRE